MTPSHREIADALHEDHMAQIDALREPPRKNWVPVVVLISALATFCAVLAGGVVWVLAL